MSIISDKRLEGINPFSETKSNIQSMYGLAKYSLSSSRKKEIEKNYRRHIGAKPTKGDQAEKEAFISAFELLLDREIREGKLKPGDQNKVKDLDIFLALKLRNILIQEQVCKKPLIYTTLIKRNIKTSEKLLKNTS